MPFARLRPWLFWSVVAGTTLVGTGLMAGVVRVHGVSVLEVVILGLFTVTFGWISIAFWNAVLGFGLLLLKRDPLSLAQIAAERPDARPIASRTALVMPVRNEDPAQTARGLAVMLRSLERTGQGDWFDFFLLSDTSDPRIAEGEAEAVETLRREAGPSARIHYRRRTRNIGRKAGNVEDFCHRWGDHYPFMVVLDADSLMSGTTLVALVRAMEANPGAGLMQTVPVPARQATLFGRLLQFAAQLYGPLQAAGQSFWHRDFSNYWGHNAIIRTAAFTALCRLPVLPGRPPLGGPILSHDFVEAALLRRGGWGVYLLAAADGSYEDAPGTIIDYARRDRRWCQGSLQHLRLLRLTGLAWMNRFHFVQGAMGYLASVLWFAMLLAGTAYVLSPQLGAGAEARFLMGVDGAAASVRTLWMALDDMVPLLAVTAGLLFVPKLLGVALALVRDRRSFGGALRLLASAVLEMVVAVVLAPIMMLYHTAFVLAVLWGRNVPWEAPNRAGRAVSWSDAWRSTAGMSLVGVAWSAVTVYASPGFFLWMIPIVTGLLLAGPAVRVTSSASLGSIAARWGLFCVPSETAPLFEPAASRSGVDRVTGRRTKVSPAGVDGGGTRSAPSRSNQA